MSDSVCKTNNHQLEAKGWYEFWWDDFTNGLYHLGEDLSEKNPSQVYVEFTDYLIDEHVKPELENASASTQAFVAGTIAATRGFFALPLIFSDLGLEIGRETDSNFNKAYQNNIMLANLFPGFKTTIAGSAMLSATANQLFIFAKGMLIDFPLMTMEQTGMYMNGEAPIEGFDGGKFFGELGLSLYLLGKTAKGATQIKPGPPINIEFPNIFPRPPALQTAGAPISVPVPTTSTIPIPTFKGFGNIGGYLALDGARADQMHTMFAENGNNPTGSFSINVPKGGKYKTTWTGKIKVNGKQHPLRKMADDAKTRFANINGNKWFFKKDGTRIVGNKSKPYFIRKNGNIKSAIVEGEHCKVIQHENKILIINVAPSTQNPANIISKVLVYDKNGMLIKNPKPIIIDNIIFYEFCYRISDVYDGGFIRGGVFSGDIPLAFQVFDKNGYLISGNGKPIFLKQNGTIKGVTINGEFMDARLKHEHPGTVWVRDQKKNVTYHTMNGDRIFNPQVGERFNVIKSKNMYEIEMDGYRFKATQSENGLFQINLDGKHHFFNSSGVLIKGTNENPMFFKNGAESIVDAGSASQVSMFKNNLILIESFFGDFKQRLFRADGTPVTPKKGHAAILTTKSSNGNHSAHKIYYDGKTFEPLVFENGTLGIALKPPKRTFLVFKMNGTPIKARDGHAMILKYKSPITQNSEHALIISNKFYDAIRHDNGVFETGFVSDNIYVTFFYDGKGAPLTTHKAPPNSFPTHNDQMALIAQNGVMDFYKNKHRTLAVDSKSRAILNESPVPFTKTLTNKNGLPIVISHKSEPFVVFHELTDGNLFYARSIRDSHSLPAKSSEWIIFEKSGDRYRALSIEESRVKFHRSMQSESLLSHYDLRPPVDVTIEPILNLNPLYDIYPITVKARDGSAHLLTLEIPKLDGLYNLGADGFLVSGGLRLPSVEQIASSLKKQPYSIVSKLKEVVFSAEEAVIYNPTLGDAKAVATMSHGTHTMTIHPTPSPWSSKSLTQIIRHELGHVVENGKARNYRMLVESSITDSRGLEILLKDQFGKNTYHATNFAERYAEFIEIYLRDSKHRAICAQHAPHVTTLIESKIAELASMGVNLATPSIAIKAIMELFFNEDEAPRINQ